MVRRAVDVEFDAIAIGIVEVQRLADAVVAGARQGDAGLDEAGEGVGEVAAGGVEDRRVVEPGVARRRRGAAEAVPGVEAEVVVVAAGGEERRLAAVALLQLEAEHAGIEGDGAVEVGDLEMHVPDASARGNGG